VFVLLCGRTAPALVRPARSLSPSSSLSAGMTAAFEQSGGLQKVSQIQLCVGLGECGTFRAPDAAIYSGLISEMTITDLDD
jgi:hypothetical protein